MNAAELDRMRNEGKHLTPPLPVLDNSIISAWCVAEQRGHLECWCGLCHCAECQRERASKQ
jgi:hypothetical protein